MISCIFELLISQKMTSKAPKNKSKKVPETGLGKVSVSDVNERIDLSHIRKPIDTSLFGLSQVLNLFETATEEVRQYIAYECDILYECRICRSIFRSLASFILHKRNYCRERYEPAKNNSQVDGEMETTIEMKDSSKEEEEGSSSDGQKDGKSEKNLESVIKRLTKNHARDLHRKTETRSRSQSSEKSVGKSIVLQKISSSDCGVFQTVFNNDERTENVNFIKTEVMEIHSILEGNEAVLDSDGKIMPSKKKNKHNGKQIICKICNKQFLTRKTMIFHRKLMHSNSHLLYPCPDCSKTLSSPASVIRHLHSTHKKGTPEVRKLREQINASGMTRSKIKKSKRKCSSLENETKSFSDTQQWLKDIEGDDALLMCEGCGKRFERKAALQAHCLMCSKHTALVELSKDSNKKNQEPEKSHKNNVTKVSGSTRRKPLLIRNIAPECKKEIAPESLDVREGAESQIDPNISKKDLDDNICATENVGSTLKENVDCADDDKECEKDTEAENPFKEIEIKSEPTDEIDNNNRKSLKTTNICKKLNDDIDTTVKEIQSMYENHVKYANDGVEDEPSVCTVNESVNDDNMEPNLCATKNIMNSSKNHKRTKTHSSEKRSSKSERTRRSSEKEEKPSKIQKFNFDDIQCQDDGRFAALEIVAAEYMDKATLSCRQCQDEFNFYSLLMEHMASHFNWYLYQCTQCEFMSFKKRLCFGHVEKSHGITVELAVSNNLVVPVPNWKAQSLSVEFLPKRCLEMPQERIMRAQSDIALWTEPPVLVPEIVTPPEAPIVPERNNDLVIVVDDDQDLPEESATEDPMVREMIMEVILGTNHGQKESEVSDCKSNISGSLEESPRPVRNRVSTIQKDFLYDMNQLNTLGKTKDNANGRKLKSVKVYGKRKKSDFDSSI